MKSVDAISVAVVMPTYNGRAFVREGLESVLVQTRLPTEIVVVDDASTDGTPEMVRGLAASSAVPIRVIVLTANSGGPGLPLNVGIESTDAEYIALLEQDDRMAPRRLELQFRCMTETGHQGLCAGRVEILDERQGGSRPLWQDRTEPLENLDLQPASTGSVFVDRVEALRTMLSHNIVITNSNVLFPRDLWRTIGGFDARYRVCGDLDFNLKCLQRERLLFVDEAICVHRRHSGSLVAVARSHAESARIRFRHALTQFGRESTEFRSAYWNLRHDVSLTLSERRIVDSMKDTWLLCASGAVVGHAYDKLRRSIGWVS